MDRAEAIKELTQWRDQMKSHGVPNYGKKLTALDLAIEALLADTVHKPDYSYEAGMVRRLKEWQELDKAIQGDAESATTNLYDVQLAKDLLGISEEAEKFQLSEETSTNDCISRQQTIEAFCDDCRGLKPVQCEHWDKCKSQKVLRSLPPATPPERTGEWVNSKGEPVDDRYSVYCSRCKAWSEYRDIYCGNCGAKMGGDDNE